MSDSTIFNHKTIYGFGDSLIAGHFNGIGMLDYFAASNHMQLYKFACNGASVMPRDPFSFPDMDGIVYDIATQIDLAPDTQPDYICFNGMTNDAREESLVNAPGRISDSFDGDYDTTTFIGAFETICYKLKTKYPNSKLLYICPHRMPTRTIHAQETLLSCVQQILNKWEIPYLDMYHDGGIDTCIEEMRIQYSYDNMSSMTGGNGTHLNAEGYEEFYAPMLEERFLLGF